MSPGPRNSLHLANKYWLLKKPPLSTTNSNSSALLCHGITQASVSHLDVLGTNIGDTLGYAFEGFVYPLPYEVPIAWSAAVRRVSVVLRTLSLGRRCDVPRAAPEGFSFFLSETGS